MLTNEAQSTPCRRLLRVMLSVAVVMVGATHTGKAQSQEAANACGPVGRGSVSEGPYDYRARNQRIAVIESNHFAPQVQALVRGQTSTIGGDLSFVLNFVPNHHKALLLLITYGEKLQWTHPPLLRYPYECYYERAIRWRPDDPMVRMIYAMYLNKRSRPNDALQQLRIAAALAGDNGFTQYNIGLIYLEMKQYDPALIQAHKAQALGFDGIALRDGLKASGKWKEPPADAEGTAATPASALAPAAAGSAP